MIINNDVLTSLYINNNYCCWYSTMKSIVPLDNFEGIEKRLIFVIRNEKGFNNDNYDKRQCIIVNAISVNPIRAIKTIFGEHSPHAV